MDKGCHLGGRKKMIYKCDENKREDLLNFLYNEPSVNLFAIGDIETYGFEHFDLDVWAYVDSKDEISGVLVRYKENVMPIHGNEFEGFDTFLPLIQSLTPHYISGSEEVIAQYEEEFEDYEKDGERKSKRYSVKNNADDIDSLNIQIDNVERNELIKIL